MPDTKTNEEKFLEMLKQVDPELYQLKVALAIARLNPVILIPIIKTLGNLLLGSGHGKLEVHMQAKIIKNIVGLERVEVNESGERE
jgi:hypothetical protein